MAGLIPGLGRFDDLGYTVSKFGAVSFTRYKKIRMIRVSNLLIFLNDSFKI